MSLNINNKIVFIDSFKFLSSSLDIFVKSFKEDDLNLYLNLSQESGNKLLDLVKQKRFHSYEYEVK